MRVFLELSINTEGVCFIIQVDVEVIVVVKNGINVIHMVDDISGVYQHDEVVLVLRIPLVVGNVIMM